MRVLLMISNSNMPARELYGMVLRDRHPGWGIANMSGLPISPATIMKGFDVVVYELGAAERAEIEARVGRARLIAITGSPAVSAFTATKLLWVRRHEPAVWARARVAMLPKDYLRLRLTGVAGTDPTDAGATGLLDLQARDWSPAVTSALVDR